MKIAFQWPISQELQQHFIHSIPEATFIFPNSKDEDEIQAVSADAEVIVGWRISVKFLAHASKLVLFINPGAGVQNLVKSYKENPPKQNFTIVNSHSNAFNTAQHTVTLTLTLLNRIIPHHKWTAEGKWRTDDRNEVSDIIRGKTIGLLGYGTIAKKVQSMLTPFECNFIGYKRNQTENSDIDLYTESQLNKFLERTDVLIHLLPETDKTRNLIGTDELKILGASSYVISMGRGPVINESALYTALNEKTIAGAAIDVWYNYSPEEDAQGRKYPWNHPFNKLDNVVLSPHRAGKPINDLHRWSDILENMKRAVVGRSDFLNVISLEEGY